MDAVTKALWQIESRMGDELTLDLIATASGVSRFHLSRAFAALIGAPPMAHLRARRLTEAAKRLAAGADDILSVALEAGYGSHEAFTRAFRDQFGQTPEQVRARRDLSQLKLTEALTMAQIDMNPLPPPQFVDKPDLLLAGFSQHYNCNAKDAIPMQWAQFAPHLGHVPGQKGASAYGVVANMDEGGNFDYLAGVEVSGFGDLTDNFARLRVPAQRYAVFTHNDHIAKIGGSFAWIWGQWISASGHTPADAPVIEHYPESFNPMTGMGGVGIWVPIKG